MAGVNRQYMARIRKEVENMVELPSYINVWPEDEDRLDIFKIVMKGPPDSPYDGGSFLLRMSLPINYPFHPPKVQFLTFVYHPNIDDQGRICLDILKMPPKGLWTSGCNMQITLMNIYSLLRNPNPDDPLSIEAATEYRRDHMLFLEKARNYTQKYADGEETKVRPDQLQYFGDDNSSQSSNNKNPATKRNNLKELLTFKRAKEKFLQNKNSEEDKEETIKDSSKKIKLISESCEVVGIKDGADKNINSNTSKRSFSRSLSNNSYCSETSSSSHRIENNSASINTKIKLANITAPSNHNLNLKKAPHPMLETIEKIKGKLAIKEISPNKVKEKALVTEIKSRHFGNNKNSEIISSENSCSEDGQINELKCNLSTVRMGSDSEDELEIALTQKPFSSSPESQPNFINNIDNESIPDEILESSSPAQIIDPHIIENNQDDSVIILSQNPSSTNIPYHFTKKMEKNPNDNNVYEKKVKINNKSTQEDESNGMVQTLIDDRFVRRKYPSPLRPREGNKKFDLRIKKK